MSSSLRPCPVGRLARLDRSGGAATLYICLVEDRDVRRSDLEKSVGEELIRGGAGRDSIGLSPEDVAELVFRFLDRLGRAVRKTISVLHGEADLIDISLPRLGGEETVNPGEFAGNFVLYNGGGSRVVLHVEPKIGWPGYIEMLRDTRQSIDVLATRTGVLEPLLGNLYYPSLSSPVSYSILLLRLTDLILSSTPPKKTVRIEVVSEGVAGRPVVHRTVKYLLQGYPLGVYERVRIEPHDYPFMLLAKFHHDLSAELARILEVLGDVAGDNGYYWLLADRVSLLRDLHLHYITTPPLHGFLDVLLKEGIAVQELLEETRRASRTNPYFGLLADLYEMYAADVGLVHEYVENGEIVPSASCKIYELWVLTRIIGFLEKRYGASLGVEEYEDLYVRLRLGLVTLEYNMPRQGPFLKLAGRRLRPDFVLRSGGRAVVYDAKYKTGISLDDVVRLLAYIAEYAYPVTVGGEEVLLGAFYKLAGGLGVEERHRAVVRNGLLPMKIAVHIHTLDPRMPRSRIEDSLERSLQPLLGT